MLITFDLANNHMGDVKHGIRIINEVARVCKGYDFDFAMKFQYRDLDTFIHPFYKGNFAYKYVKRFTETRLSWEEFKELKDEAKRLGFKTECTPFDEASVDKIEEFDFDIIKIASCSFTDWPLLERIAKTHKWVIASTACASLTDIDRVVSFFIHRNSQFALMHCVAEYPTPRNHLQLNQIDLLRDRYPQIPIGFSTHEDPSELAAVKMAIAKGAQLLERHVGMTTIDYAVNKYSSEPGDIECWLMSIQEALDMGGTSKERMEFTELEKSELRALGRGVFAKRDIEKGERIKLSDIFLAIPTLPNQLIANDLSKYTAYYAKEWIQGDSPIWNEAVERRDHQEKVYEILKKVKKIINDSGISVPNKVDAELSHHYGIDRFYEWGCTLINVINREYCKKLIVVLPNQRHPEQYHEVKEETFHVLYGEVELTLDGQGKMYDSGDVITVERGVKHAFTSPTGAIIEEISSTHYKSDSFYTDPEIAKNTSRKTEITYWV